MFLPYFINCHPIAVTEGQVAQQGRFIFKNNNIFFKHLDFKVALKKNS